MRYPDDGILYRSTPETAHLDAALVALPSGRVVTGAPLADKAAPMLGGALMRASLARCDVAPALWRFGLVPILPEVFRELAAVGFWVPPHFLVFDAYDQAHMTSLGYAREHDRRVWADLRKRHNLGPSDLERLPKPIVWGKTHAAGPDGVVDRMVGFDLHDDGRADLIQSGIGPNHAAQPDVHDYGTHTYGMVP